MAVELLDIIQIVLPSLLFLIMWVNFNSVMTAFGSCAKIIAAAHLDIDKKSGHPGRRTGTAACKGWRHNMAVTRTINTRVTKVNTNVDSKTAM